MGKNTATISWRQQRFVTIIFTSQNKTKKRENKESRGNERRRKGIWQRGCSLTPNFSLRFFEITKEGVHDDFLGELIQITLQTVPSKTKKGKTKSIFLKTSNSSFSTMIDNKYFLFPFFILKEKTNLQVSLRYQFGIWWCCHIGNNIIRG